MLKKKIYNREKQNWFQFLHVKFSLGRFLKTKKKKKLKHENYTYDG